MLCINMIGGSRYDCKLKIFVALPLFAPGGLPYALDGYTGMPSPIKGGGGYLSGIAYLRGHRDSKPIRRGAGTGGSAKTPNSIRCHVIPRITTVRFYLIVPIP